MTFSRLCRYLQLNKEYGRVDLLFNSAGMGVMNTSWGSISEQTVWMKTA
jgi:hypothetical protein